MLELNDPLSAVWQRGPESNLCCQVADQLTAAATHTDADFVSWSVPSVDVDVIITPPCKFFTNNL